MKLAESKKIKGASQKKKDLSWEEIEARFDETTRERVGALRHDLERTTRDRADVEAKKAVAMKSYNDTLRGLDEQSKQILDEIANHFTPMPLLDGGGKPEGDDDDGN